MPARRSTVKHSSCLTEPYSAAARRRDRLIRLLNNTIELHGVQGIGLLLEALERERGDLGVDAHLEHLVAADPAELRRLEAGV